MDRLKNRVRFSTTLDKKTVQALKEYSNSSMIPVSKLIDVAVHEYMEKHKKKSDWRKVIKNDEEYNGFTIFDKPAKFKDIYINKDIPRVQLYSINVYTVAGEEHVMGFCGVFEWKDNKIIPIDGDSYSDNLSVYGYEADKDCLCILVGNDW